MSLLALINTYNYYLSLPTAFLLFAIALWLTIKLKFIQLSGLGHCIRFFKHGIAKNTQHISSHEYVQPLYALFTAMSTSIGMGTIVGPSVAILMGGPGALLWLLIYAFLGSVIKFAEVAFGIFFRVRHADGRVVGGPMQYLSVIHPYLGIWYASATMLLFASWSAIQANVMAEILYQEGVPLLLTGCALAFFIMCMLLGGAERIGAFSSKLVPLMFIIYVSMAMAIIFLYRATLYQSITLIIRAAFLPQAPIGGFIGSALGGAFCAGIYKGAFITESGIGTSAIPHALADVKKPTDQALLAMTGVAVDIFLCLVSGLLVIITDVWKSPCMSNTLIYQVFQDNFPLIGRPVLMIALSMFVTGTILGNSFNGRQSFLTIMSSRWLAWYYFFLCGMIILGSISHVPVMWASIELLLPFVAIPNALGIIYLSKRYSTVIAVE